jgi:hypothetical protein
MARRLGDVKKGEPCSAEGDCAAVRGPVQATKRRNGRGAKGAREMDA